MVTGHVEKRGKKGWNSIRLFFGRDPATGKRIRKRITIERPDGKPVTKREAQAKLREILAEIDHGTYVEPTDLTVAEYLERWFEAIRPRLAYKTVRAYRTAIERHINPRIGALRLDALRPLHVQEMYQDLLENGREKGPGTRLSPKTVQLTHTVLRSALKQAVKWELVRRNVTDAVDPPKARRKEIRALSAEELSRLLSVARGHNDYTIIALLARTGLRIGELFALRWSDVDLDKRTLLVKRKLVKEGRFEEISEPKTRSGQRQVPLPDSAVAVLREHRRRQMEDRLRQGPDYQNLGLVVCRPDGRPLEPTAFRRRFRRIASEAGLAGFRPHDLRHTYATLLLSAGVPLRVVQELLGHARPTTTLENYSHVLPGHREAAAAKLDEIVPQLSPNSIKTS